MSQQRHFSVSQAAEENHSLQKDSQRQLRTVGSVSSLIPAKTLTLLNDDSQTIGEYVYRKMDEIGSGYSSRVYRCRSLKREGQFALKVIDIKKYTNSSLEMLENEISILKKLNHPNILRLQHVYKHPNNCYIVTEYCPEGDLLEYLTRNGKLCEKEAVSIIAEVIEAVKYLFKMGVIHRDIKPANIFKSHKIWKLGDFGFSILSEGQVKTRQNVGTPLYMPLQSLQRNCYSPQSDIFAVGVICYQMMVGITPWQSKSEKELMRKMSTLPFTIPQKYKITSPIRYLLGKMCQPNRDERMTKEEFMDLNINNFVSLISFNEQLKATEYKRKGRIFSVGKIDKEIMLKSGKKDLLQTQKPTSRGKIETEYGTVRKTQKIELKGHPKVEIRSTSRKKIIDVKIYGNRNRQKSRSSQKVYEQKIIQKNYEIIVNQLNYCRFMYYLIQNNSYLMLSNNSKGRLTLMLFKHLLKIAKQLADNKNNCFGLADWDTFRKSSKYTTTLRTLKDYCEKYEKEYLIFLKKAEINVIKDVNHQLPQFTSSDPFTVPFYKKILSYLLPLLKQCNQNVAANSYRIREAKADDSSAKLQALKAIYKYYRLIEMSMNEFQNYEHFNRHSNISVLKNYRESKIKEEDSVIMRQEIRMI